MKLNICGVSYKVLITSDLRGLNKLCEAREVAAMVYPERHKPDETETYGCDGFCDTNRKEIHVWVKPDVTSVPRVMRVLMHEVTHASLYEAGYSDWGDERVVERIAAISLNLIGGYNKILPVIEGRINNGKIS